MVLAVKLKSPPRHTGELLPAVGAEGVWLMVTETVPAGVLTHPFAPIAVTEYVPDAEVVTPEMVGFCKVEVKLFGPVQL